MLEWLLMYLVVGLKYDSEGVVHLYCLALGLGGKPIPESQLH